jgi:hypothetical protein
LSSEPAAWARDTAFVIREHDRDRFLDAKHGSKIEDFWTSEFIQARGCEYCEALLQYIICFNHEEVGGTAVMWMDQMMMWQPHYFPYSMKYKHHVEDFFEKDQIEHYGRKFLEKVVEWCKGVYRDHRAYYDELLANPPSGQNLDAFIEMIRQKHSPKMLKELGIMHESRPDDWPVNYFSRARGKPTLPQPEPVHQRVESIRKTDSHGKAAKKTANAYAGTQPKDAHANEKASTQPSSSNTASQTTATQSDSGTSKGKKASAKASAKASGPTFRGGGHGNDGGDSSDDEDTDRQPRDSKPPQSPKSKKEVQSDDEGDDLKAAHATIHRRVKSEADSPGKSSVDFPDLLAPKTFAGCEMHKRSMSHISMQLRTNTLANNDLVKKGGLSLQDWMTAPGVERRAVSSQEQSQLPEKAMNNPINQSGRVPNTGRGGAVAAIGRYLYGPSSVTPSFTHPYAPDTVAQNNAAYLYHQDHTFGRSYPPQPDHSTTYRPGSNIYQTDAQRGDMFVPVAQPQPHYSYRMPSGTYGYQQGDHQSHGTNQMPGSTYGSRHINAMALAQPMLSTPPIVPTAPHGVVPNHNMEPYLQQAAQGVYPQHVPPLSRVGVPPTHPGHPAMRHPPQFVARAPGMSAYGPQFGQSSPRIGMSHQVAIRGGGGAPSTSQVGPRNIRRDMVRSEPIQLSPRAASFHLNNPRPLPQGPANSLPSGPAAGLGGLPDRPVRAAVPRQYLRHNSSTGDTVPFPQYDEMLDPTDLPESQQCTSTSIGPDAEDVVTLWFADIPQGTTTDQLRHFIEQMMPVAELRPITFDQKQAYAKGWSFVKFLSNTDARRALDTFQGAAFNGGQIKVQVPERRTNNGRRNRSSFRQFGMSQSSDQADGFMSHQPSFSGSNNSPARFRDYGVGASPSGARRSRGNSMSQAMNAVRRNSTFSKQDARSGLPLGNLPDVAEASKPATPAPEQQSMPHGNGFPSMHGDEHVEAVKKPKKKKPKKRKKKPDQSRDGSVAPSDSNISSAVESSATPRLLPDDATTDEGVKDKGKRAADTQSRAASPLKFAVQLKDSPTKPDSQTREEFVVGAISDFEDGATSTIAASEKAMSEDTVVHTPEDDLAASSAELAVPSVDTDTVLHEAPRQDETEAETAAEEAPTAIDEQEPSETTSVTSDHKSEATTVQVEPPAAGPSKAKAKGPAQTESLSMFGMSKHQKKAEKNKAKKARQASRKVSKTLNLATMDVPKVAESSASVAGKENRKASGKDKQAVSRSTESSSLAGTPETAREYPASLPDTPPPKLSGVVTRMLSLFSPVPLFFIY